VSSFFFGRLGLLTLLDAFDLIPQVLDPIFMAAKASELFSGLLTWFN
jgi:hypothetical protein